MAHKCFISFKTQDHEYKKYIHDELEVDMIDKSLHEPIDSDDEDYIMRKIRENYLSDSTVTIFLIGSNSAENSWFENQNFIKRELQASLYNGVGNTKNGILGVVLPSMTSQIYRGSQPCSDCGGSHNIVKINDDTVIKEFSYNYQNKNYFDLDSFKNKVFEQVSKHILYDSDNFINLINYKKQLEKELDVLKSEIENYKKPWWLKFKWW